MSEKVRIIDRRKNDKFFVHDGVIDTWGRILGPLTTCVYFALCRYANREQKAFPSQQLIADKLGISRRQVIRCIQTLKKYNFIELSHVKFHGKWQNTIYLLLDQSQWGNHVTTSHIDRVTYSHSPCDNNDIHHVTTSHTKELISEGVKYKERGEQLNKMREELKQKGII